MMAKQVAKQNALEGQCSGFPRAACRNPAKAEGFDLGHAELVFA
jgi:hypothetical protein